MLPLVQGHGAHVGKLLTRRAVTIPRAHEGRGSENIICQSQYSLNDRIAHSKCLLKYTESEDDLA